MTIAIIITLLVIAAASVSLNVYQQRERKSERKEHNECIAANARLETQLTEVKALYENECQHRQWAIGRIKDQQAVIDRLSAIRKQPRKGKP